MTSSKETRRITKESNKRKGYSKLSFIPTPLIWGFTYLWNLIKLRNLSNYSPYKPLPFIPVIYYPPCLPNIQTFFFSSGHSWKQSTSSADDLLNDCTCICPFSNPIILFSLNMAKPSENTFVNPFIHTSFSYNLCIWHSILSSNT